MSNNNVILNDRYNLMEDTPETVKSNKNSSAKRKQSKIYDND